MIKFGTDGWRGIIGEDYTFDKVRLVSRAIADYIISLGQQQDGIAVGYDARFLGRQFAEACAAELAAAGIKVWLADSIMPTPALTWQVVDRQAAGGIMITASHNPPEYNGLKFKASYGGSANPEIMAKIAEFVAPLEAVEEIFAPRPLTSAVSLYSPRATYLAHVKDMLEAKVIGSFRGKAVFDVMHGGAMGYPTQLAKELGINLIEIRSEINPSFGGVNPEPIEKNLVALQDAVKFHSADIGLATDGDGDRIGAVDRDGRYINAHQIMALLTKYAVEKRGWTGGVAQSLTVSELVKRIAAKYGLKLYETPVGFKYITDLMIQEDILIGGEESGGIGLKNYIPERDGVMLGFMLIEMVAAYGKTLGELLDEMMDEVGYFYYSREDLHLTNERKESLMQGLINEPVTTMAGMPVRDINRADGCKLYVDNGWVMFRASGTEPIVRVYAEASSKELLAEILVKAVQYARGE